MAADRLLSRVAPWSQPRWAQAGPAARGEPAGLPGAVGADRVTGWAGPPNRADVVFGLVQRLADAAADAEGRPRRPVPRLNNDLVIPDQLRVMVADLLALDPATTGAVRSATAWIDAVRREL